MNQVDTTSGYVVDQSTIQNTPLGTGSFTQLAILAPGVHADFLGGGGQHRPWQSGDFGEWEPRHQQQLFVERRQHEQLV